ncbi:type II toxin-antitoxin system VapC family toxin [Oxalobacteraceae bacterium]|nr:type II toxin-antitoxin system VapC family toxin [Oxalobacteraceae bacterium]
MALSWKFERQDSRERDCSKRALLATLDRTTLVPSLWHTEVSNGLLVGERRKLITTADTSDFLTLLDDMPIVIDLASPAERRDPAMTLARLYGLTSYDASYLDLLLRTGGMLASFDRKLVQAARNAGRPVFE